MTHPLPPDAFPSDPSAGAPEHVPATDPTLEPTLEPTLDLAVHSAPGPALAPEPAEISEVPAAPAPDRTRFAEPVATATPETPSTVIVGELDDGGAAEPVVGPPADLDVPATEPLTPAAPPASVDAEPTPVAAEPSPASAPVAVPAARGRGLVAVLAALVVVLALATGFLAWRAQDTQGAGPVDVSRRAALDAARSAARLVFSYDYRHLDKDFKAGRATTTGQFQGEYDKTTARLVSDVAPRYKAVVQADVSDASVVSASENQVVTLVFLNQQSSSSLLSTPKITQSRLEMTMVRKGGHWLVSKIKAL